jgi:hypothetical protein
VSARNPFALSADRHALETRVSAGDELIKKCFDSYLGVSCMRLALISRRLYQHKRAKSEIAPPDEPAGLKRKRDLTQWEIDERTSYSLISSFSHWPFALTANHSASVRSIPCQLIGEHGKDGESLLALKV